VVRRQFLSAALPPPPVPEASDGGSGAVWPLLAVAGLTLALLTACAIGVMVERVRVARRRRRLSDPVVGRIELWHDGAADVIGYAADPASGDPTFAVHLARARAEGGRGTLVLIDPVSDAIVALCPIVTVLAPARSGATSDDECAGATHPRHRS
jgi:hypothetical protein